MFYEDLNHNVLKLDIHDGGHRLLLWAEQSRPEDHAQVGHRHQIVLIVTGHAVGDGEPTFKSLTHQQWVKQVPANCSQLSVLRFSQPVLEADI